MEEHIHRIEAKVQLLLKEYQQSQKEVMRLQKENETLRSTIEQNNEKSNALAQTIDVLKIHALTQNDDSKKDLEKRINNYLKEIDKCLSMLQS